MGTHLDSTQLAAAEHGGPVTMVSATAGAGKTRCLVAAIRHKIATGAHPRSVFCMTFTNAGAHELAERLGNIRLGYLGTLHGFCFRLLQRHGALIGYREGGINLVGEELSLELLKESAAKFKYKGSAKALMEARDTLAQLCHQRHQFELKRNNLVNYDGVLRETIELLSKHSENPALKAEVFGKLLFGDEMQDSALADWEIYRLLQPASAFFVGDDDQSIFSFRGAHPAAFKEAWDSAPEGSCFKLERNYRSGAAICRAAESLIWHNTKRVPKHIIPMDNAEDSMTTFNQYDSDETERRTICARIRSKIEDGMVPSDIAVLCRTNKMARDIRETLVQHGVATLRHAEGALPPDFGYALDVLSLFADPRSDILAERVLKRYAPAMLSKLKSEAADGGSWLSSVAAFENVTPIVNHPMTMAAIPEDLLKWRVSRETCELIGTRIAQLPPESTLTDLRHDLFGSKNWGDKETGVGVFVGTAHSAKGKEFDIVFAIGIEQEDWPGTRDDEEESRRLFFVLATRARRELHVSCASTRVMEWGGMKPRTPSKFIREAGLL